MRAAGRAGVLALALGVLVASLLPARAEAAPRRRRGAPAQVDRSERRAFYTAPPTIPHSIEGFERDNKKCLSCHTKEKRLGRRMSMRTPHPELSNCLQCHVADSGPLVMMPAQSRILPQWAQGENTFEGLSEPKKGERLYPSAPPTIPHRIFMRENCAGCHTTRNPNKEMRLSHPYRRNCQQCHVAQKEAQF